MENKCVKDLMLALDEYATVPAGATIRDALLALDRAQLGLDHDRHHHRAVIVMDDDGNVIGKLSHWAILRRIQPGFLRSDDVVALSRAGLTQEFIETLAGRFSSLSLGLKSMCAEAARIKARDAMVPIEISIDEEASLTQAIHELVISHAQSMLVIRNGTAVGILRLSDVFEEVATAIRGAVLQDIDRD